MSTLFVPESTQHRGYMFATTRGVESQGDAGWGVQRKEPAAKPARIRTNVVQPRSNKVSK